MKTGCYFSSFSWNSDHSTVEGKFRHKMALKREIFSTEKSCESSSKKEFCKVWTPDGFFKCENTLRKESRRRFEECIRLKNWENFESKICKMQFKNFVGFRIKNVIEDFDYFFCELLLAKSKSKLRIWIINSKCLEN